MSMEEKNGFNWSQKCTVKLYVQVDDTPGILYAESSCFHNFSISVRMWNSKNYHMNTDQILELNSIKRHFMNSF